jgi:putative oligomerization/nucleic acid binding protein
VGLFGFLRRKDEKAIPQPGSAEFQAAVQGSALPASEGGQTVSMGESGWTNPSSADEALRQLGVDPSKAQVESSSETIDLRGTDTREKIVGALRAHGIDPDKQGQTINAASVPGLQESILSILGQVMPIPNAGGFGGGVAAPQQEPLAVVEQLAKKRDAGEITDAEFQAQKKRVLGE